MNPRATLLLLATLSSARLAAQTLPPNDNFANRIIINPNGGEFSGSTLNATVEEGEPNWNGWWNDPNGAYKSVWWSWTPTISGYAAIEALEAPRGLGFAVSGLDVRRGSTFAEISAEDSKVALLLGRLPSWDAFPVTAGQTYSFALIGSADEFWARPHRFRVAVSPNPVILRQPQNISIRSGGSAFFEILAPDVPFTNIRWQRNGADVRFGGELQVGPTLQANNVLVAQAGEYRAVLTVPGGEFFSAPATLIVEGEDLRPTVYLTQTAEQNQFNIRVAGQAEMNYTIQLNPADYWEWLSLPAPIGFDLPSDLTVALPNQLVSQNSHLMLRAQRRGDIRQWCISNLRRIALAKEHYLVRNYQWEAAFPDVARVDEYFGFFPLHCPHGGSYVYGALNVLPTCDVEGHAIPIAP